MAEDFEKIKAWDGTSGTGADARRIINDNFDKIREELDEQAAKLENGDMGESIALLLADKLSISPQSLTEAQKAQVRQTIGVTQTGGTVVNNEMVVSETAPEGEVLTGKKWFSLATGEEFNRVGDVWITD